MTRPTIADLPPNCVERNRRVLGLATPEPRKAPILAPAKAIRRPTLRQQTGNGLNGLETAFLAYLEQWKERCGLQMEVKAQAVTLEIANGCRYTPDFVTVETVMLRDEGGNWRHSRQLSAYECKGFMRDDAAVKLKVAAALYPWIAFHLVTRRKGEWRIEQVFGHRPELLPERVLADHLGPQD